VEAFQNKRVVIGVTGSIAAYKTCDLVFTLRKADAHPVVVMTEAAERLVTAETFRALSGEPAHVRMWDHPQSAMPHITLLEDADLVIVAPATANFLAKLAHGIADDLLSTLMLTAACPVVVAPAMNVEMWNHASVQRNAAQVRADGVHLIEPVSGELACRVEGKGKMAPIETILETARRLLYP